MRSDGNFIKCMQILRNVNNRTEVNIPAFFLCMFLSFDNMCYRLVYNEYLLIFTLGESPHVRTRRDSANRCRGRNSRGVNPRNFAECLGIMLSLYSLRTRRKFVHRRICPRRSRGHCWFCVSCTVIICNY